MKISKLFHWLYCIVMMLPVFVLPIFALAVRSDNNYQPISITTGGYEVLPLYQTNQPNVDLSNLNNDYIYSFDLSYGNNFNALFTYNDEYDFFYFTYLSFYDSNGDWFVFSDDSFYGYIDYSPLDSKFYVYNEDLLDFKVPINSNSTLYIVTAWSDISSYLIDYGFVLNASDYIPNDYVYNSGLVYNDTDFGSQTIYTLYKEVDTYFNYDNVFNFGEMYSWLNTTFFSGSAPLGFFIFWHLLIYWLLTSLLWLLFDVLMYVPQLCHRWLDKASLE